MSAWRFYAMRALTGAWLDRDLELYDVQLTWALSGPGAMTAKVDPILAREVAPDGLLILREWSTAVFAELDGQIRWGGLLHSSAPEDGGARSLEFIGYSGYPKGRIYGGNYRQWEADPFDVIRTLWAYVQSTPNSNISMTVPSTKSSYRLGDAAKGSKPIRADYATQNLYNSALVEWTNYAGQAYELAWWNTTDCGDEIDSVTAESSSEWYETHKWATNERQSVIHSLKLADGPIGARRSDLRFVEGENLAVPPRPKRDGDIYANQVTALGAGEERFMLRKEAGGNYPGILRRDKVVSGKDIYSENRLFILAKDEFARSSSMLVFDSMEIFDHPNASIGSFGLGDEIRVQTHSGFESIDAWVKITEYSQTADESDIVSISVTRLV